MAKKKSKSREKTKNLNKILEQSIRIKIFTLLTVDSIQSKNTHNADRFAEEINYIKRELEIVSLSNEDNDLVLNIVQNKELFTILLDDFLDFIQIVFSYNKYENLMSLMSIESKVINDKNISYLLDSTVRKIRSKNITLNNIHDISVFLNYIHKSAANLTKTNTILLNYIMLLSTFVLKVKNNKIAGVINKNGNYEIKYSRQSILDNVDVKNFYDLEAKIIFVYQNKKFAEFFRDYYNIPVEILKLESINIRTEMKNVSDEFHYNKSEFVYLSKPLNKSYPFISMEEFDIEFYDYGKRITMDCDIADNDLGDIIHNKKYALGRNGAIIEFLNKTKAVDFVEVLETEDKYYFKVRYFNKDKVLYSLKDTKGRSANNTICIKSDYIDCIQYTDKEEINNLIQEISENGLVNSMESIQNIFSDSNYIFITKNEMLIHNGANKECYINNIEHKIKQCIMLLNCLYVLYCNIKIEEVKVYARKVEVKNGKSRTTKESYRTAYIRKLPKGWNASLEAKANAEEMNVILPAGYTFVREHLPSKEKNSKRIVTVRE